MQAGFIVGLVTDGGLVNTKTGQSSTTILGATEAGVTFTTTLLARVVTAMPFFTMRGDEKSTCAIAIQMTQLDMLADLEKSLQFIQPNSLKARTMQVAEKA